MKRNAWLAIGIILLLVMFPAIYWHMNHRASRVGFHFRSWGFVSWLPDTPWANKWYWTRDPEFLAQVQAWRADLRHTPHPHAALRQSGGVIVVEYASGRTETFTHLSLSVPGDVLGTIGYFDLDSERYYSDAEPFSEFLKTLPADPMDAAP